MSDGTRILKAAQQGDPQSAEELLPLVYGELRKLRQLAVHKLTNEAGDHTLQPGIWVHQVWFAASLTLKDGRLIRQHKTV